MIALPTLSELPDADVVIFDGQCQFCRGQVERLHRWDGRGRLSFLSLHDDEVARRFPDLTHDQMMQQMYVVDSHGNRHGGAAALRYLTRRLPRLWVLAPLTHIPFSLPLWQVLYRQVARRRYLLGGRRQCDSEACALHLHPPAERRESAR